MRTQTKNAEISRSTRVRERLNHPIIDSDGHVAEFEPALFDYLEEVGGAALVQRLKSMDSPFSFRWYGMTPQERRDSRAPRPHWWAHPTRMTLDRATSSLPRLLYDRLDEMGLDFTVIYPSIGMFALHLGDEEMRRAFARAYNRLHADLFREYRDRIAPVAVIPMHTPAEAIEELDYAIGTLGYRAILMPAYARRPVPAVARKAPEAARYAYWLDNFCLDSEYDYDPVWAKCVELKVAPTFHSPSAGMFTRASLSNFMFNHLGHFAASAESICKALIFGGVAQRFPRLRFAFMEGGVGWACALYNDIIGHWQKRNLAALSNLDPKNLDEPLLRNLFHEYGGDYRGGLIEKLGRDRSHLLWGRAEDPSTMDEWARGGVADIGDLRAIFDRMFFGCEGDDRLTALAFDTRKNPTGSRLNAIYSSDIGHFDLPDMRDAAYEAHELVEDGLISEEDFRDFVFTNPARMKTEVNPDFFRGTRIEHDIERLIASKS